MPREIPNHINNFRRQVVQLGQAAYLGHHPECMLVNRSFGEVDGLRPWPWTPPRTHSSQSVQHFMLL